MPVNNIYPWPGRLLPSNNIDRENKNKTKVLEQFSILDRGDIVAIQCSMLQSLSTNKSLQQSRDFVHTEERDVAPW